MSQKILAHVASGSMKKKIPVLNSGNVVRVHQKIKEGGKERVQIFEGLIIRINSGEGVNKTFTVRKMVDGVGVEKIFPFYSPNIKQIDIVKGGKVRRSKLYYMRELTGKSARLRDQKLGEVEMIGEDPTPEDPEVAETPKSDSSEVAEQTEATPVVEASVAETSKVEAKEEAPTKEVAEKEEASTEEKAA